MAKNFEYSGFIPDEEEEYSGFISDEPYAKITSPIEQVVKKIPAEKPKPILADKNAALNWGESANPQLAPGKKFEQIAVKPTIPADTRGTAIQAHQGSQVTEPFSTPEFVQEGQQIGSIAAQTAREINKLPVIEGAVRKSSSFFGGIAGTVESAGGIMQVFPEDSGVYTLGKLIEEVGSDAGSYLSVPDQTFTEKLFGAAGSSLPMILPGVGAMGLAGKIGMTVATSSMIGSGTTAFLNSAINAGQVRSTVMDRTGDEHKADVAAAWTFAANLPLNFFLNRYIFNKIPETGKALAIAKGGAFEGIEEGGEQLIQNIASKEPEIMAGVLDSALVGLAFGGGIQAVKAIVDNPNIPKENKERAIAAYSKVEANRELLDILDNQRKKEINNFNTQAVVSAGSTALPQQNLQYRSPVSIPQMEDNILKLSMPQLAIQEEQQIELPSAQVGAEYEGFIPDEIQSQPQQINIPEQKQEQVKASFRPEILQQMRTEIESGSRELGNLIRDQEGSVTGRFGATSYFPTYFQKKGFSKAQALSVFNNLDKGKPLTERQLNFITNAYYDSGYPQIHEQAIKQIDEELSSLGPNAINALNTATQEEYNQLLTDYELVGILTSEDLSNVIRNINTRVQEGISQPGPNIKKATGGIADATTAAEFNLSGDINEYNAEQQRVNSKLQQEEALSKYQQGIETKYGKEGKESIDQQTDMFGNDVKNQGETQDLFSQKQDMGGEKPIPRGASYGDYANDIPYRSEEERQAYSGQQRSRIQLPELITLVNTLTGKEGIGTVRKFAREGVRGQAQGTNINLLAELAKGKKIAQDFSEKHTAFESFKANVRETFGDIKDGYNYTIEKTKDGYIFKAFDKSIDQLEKTLSHEIGHVVDFMPNESMETGNIFAKISTIKGYLKNILSAYPGGPTEKLTDADRNRLKRLAEAEARKLITETKEELTSTEIPLTPEDIVNVWNNVSSRETNPRLVDYIAGLTPSQKKSILVEAMRGKVGDWVTFKNIMTTGEKKTTTTQREVVDQNKYKEYYEKLIKDELQKRGIFEKEAVLNELKELSRKWRPFNRNTAPVSYTAYRDSSDELFADAVSVMLNNPELLQKDAPLFNKAMHNWMDMRPEFKKVYDDINTLISKGSEEVLNTRVKNKIEQEERQAKKRLEEYKQKQKGVTKGPGPIDSLLIALVDIKTPIYDKMKEVLKRTTATPEMAYKVAKLKNQLEEVNYTASIAKNYVREVENKVQSILDAADVTSAEFDTFLFYRRTATERKYLNNPFGSQNEYAVNNMGQFFKIVGPEKSIAMIEAANNWWDIRKEEIIKPLKDSNMYNKELMDYIEDNNNYVFFNISDYLDDNIGHNRGKSGFAEIKRQTGTLKESEGALSGTILKDISLLNSAYRNSAAKNLLLFVQEYFSEEFFPARKIYNKATDTQEIIDVKDLRNFKGLPKDFSPDDYSTISFMHKGKLEAAYIDKYMAEMFKDNYTDPEFWMKSLLSTSSFLKALMTTFSVSFTVKNFFRDSFRLMKNLAGTSTIPYLYKAFGETKNDVFKNISSQTLKEMYKSGEIIVGRQYGSVDQLTTEDQFKRLVSSYKKDTGGIGIQNFSTFIERWTKVAGHMYLKDHQQQLNLSDSDIAMIVRSEIGSPDFLARGKYTRLINNIFLFSNPAIQGIRGDIRAFKRNKLRYSMWYAAMVGMPLLLELAMEQGLMGDDKKEQMRGISANDKARLFVIPFGLDENDKTKYFKIYLTPDAQVLKSILYMTAHMKSPSELTKIMSELWGFFPFSGSNPLLNISKATGSYLTNKNYIDPFTGQPIISPENFEVGGTRAAKDLATYAFNNLFGSTFGRIRTYDKSAIKSDTEKIMRLPGIGPILNSFVGISDRGRYEEVKDIFNLQRKEKAGSRLDMLDVIRDDVENISGFDEALAKKNVLYHRLNKEGILDRSNYRSFSNAYAREALAKITNNEFLVRLILGAESNKEKEQIIKEYPEALEITRRFRRLSR